MYLLDARALRSLTVCLSVFASAAWSAASYDSSTVYTAVPANITSSGIKPMLMLLASKDHTLFSPIYTDFEDLDGDGVIDVTFKPDFKYYGYFDATKCYEYSTANQQFEPSRLAARDGARYVCGGAREWSGNFLNWATMSRLDIVRKMLYGGQRSTDTTTATTLQAARLSRDSHSFVKYYRGTDIRDYTPFTTTYLTKNGGANPGVYAGLSLCMQSDANNNGLAGTPRIRMAIGNYRLWATVEGKTVCDWESSAFGNKLSRYFGGTDRHQGNGGVNHEISNPVENSDGARYNQNTIGPYLNVRVRVCVADLLGEERCQAYGSGNFQVYKPVGLLQEFAMPQPGSASARTEIGLISGSYDRNLTAGALRKNMDDLLDEIDPSTGRFCFSEGDTSGSGICPSGTLSDGRNYRADGAIFALDRIVLFGKKHNGYDGSDGQSPSEMTNGSLPAWGNPMGEMLIQALQYYAAGTSTNPSSTPKDGEVKMPVATWRDPLSDTNTERTKKYGKAICRPLNILALSSSALSFDHDQADAAFALLPNRSLGSLAAFTDAVGAAEGINGTVRSVGSVSGGFGETCSAKTVETLSKASGVCPEAPALAGSYKIAGAALYANTNRVRTPSSAPADLPAWALKVKTYAASLAGGVARIQVQIPGTGTADKPPRYVYITPEGLWAASANTKRMPAAMLTFQAISASNTHGAFVVTWNDSQFGGDYDMDITGYLRYDIVDSNGTNSAAGTKIKVTTDILNVGSAVTGSHGFSIVGTNFDGRFLTHRHKSSDSVISGAEGYLCGNATYSQATDLSVSGLSETIGIPLATGNGSWACNASTDTTTVDNRNGKDSPISMTFDMLGAEAVTLRDPLWYAVKYGSFNLSNNASTTERPDAPSKWDARRNDGKACGGSTGLSCSDGEPDGYFLARRPELLEQQLRNTLETVVSTTNSAPAVSSFQLSAGSYKYIPTFEPSQYSGSVAAYAMDANGQFSSAASWDVGAKLTQMAAGSRHVITNDNTLGMALKTGVVYSNAFRAALRGSGNGSISENQANELINYVRGVRSQEKPAGMWRTRSLNNIMGTIVNSSPWIQSRPSAQRLGLFSSETPSYASFMSAQVNRDRLLWVGSNDGLLHGFKAQDGAPVISYLPSPLVGRLRTLSQDLTQIVSGMDGSPYTGDVLITSGSTLTWKTYLFSSLGRGGRAVFALDVTAPNNLVEANASNIYKWMFSDADDADLGYGLSDTQLHPVSNQATPIVRMNNDKFAILVPNGPGSGSGRAFVYVLFVDGPNTQGNWTHGTHYVKLPTDNLAGNGMMGVNWADTNNDGKADVLYGTDLKGRLWKFDVSSTNPADWGSAFSASNTPAPLFTAMSDSNPLSISTAPVLSFPSYDGVMISFGTGDAISSDSFSDAGKTQRFYSIYDRINWGARVLPSSNLTTLVQRTLVRTSDGSVYVSSAATAFNKETHDGWYVNFPAVSANSTANNEMVLSNPQIKGNVIFFTTVRPTADTNRCYNEPEGSFYAVDPFTGTPTASILGTTVVVVNGQTLTVNKIGGAVQDQKITMPLQLSKGKANFKIVGQKTNLDLPEFMRLMRRQWREISGMRTDQ